MLIRRWKELKPSFSTPYQLPPASYAVATGRGARVSWDLQELVPDPLPLPFPAVRLPQHEQHGPAAAAALRALPRQVQLHTYLLLTTYYYLSTSDLLSTYCYLLASTVVVGTCGSLQKCECELLLARRFAVRQVECEPTRPQPCKPKPYYGLHTTQGRHPERGCIVRQSRSSPFTTYQRVASAARGAQGFATSTSPSLPAQARRQTISSQAHLRSLSGRKALCIPLLHTLPHRKGTAHLLLFYR